MKNLILFFFITILFTACNQDKEPEQVLRSYINMRFQKSPNLKDLIKKTTGELRADLLSLESSISDKEKFEQSSRFNNKKLKIIGRDCKEKECKITYIVSYDSESKENPYNAQIRNIATLVLEEGTWKISNVGGLKSYIESKKDIEP